MDIFLYPIDIDLMLCIFALPQCRLILIFRIEKRGLKRIVRSGQFLLRFPPFFLGVFSRKSGGNFLLLFLRGLRNALHLLRVFLLMPRRLCIFILFYFLLKSVGKRIHPLYRLMRQLFFFIFIPRRNGLSLFNLLAIGCNPGVFFLGAYQFIFAYGGNLLRQCGNLVHSVFAQRIKPFRILGKNSIFLQELCRIRLRNLFLRERVLCAIFGCIFHPILR